ncbi:lipopolysaccharide biosynthesis protein [Bacillus sp. SCS-151]|uniref:lipopolysaccharide biosynthesis protein n=1 Tax=Nanhaiella sioensis TaxID=3115293 RepID=UPI00397BF611
MDNKELKGKMINATKWATLTEIAAKVVTPITNMILARILAPEAFGVVATITMIISFADMFTDAGFQKYLVQREFKDKEEKLKNTNVAFWTNLGISLFLWGIIIIFSDLIATLVGNPGLGIVVAISCMGLPLTSFSSIQMALYRRSFDFRTLFTVRVGTVCIPFFITIPLALFGLGYWSLIIGMIAGQLFSAIVLTVKSEWKPSLFYKFKILRRMMSFSIWSLIEGIMIWFTIWVDVLIISGALSVYYLGIYKTSIMMVDALFGLIIASTAPVLFSALSRLQHDNEKFNLFFFKIQRYVSLIVFPLGIGVYLYSDLATQIFLGNDWYEASDVIGYWALTSAIMVGVGRYCSEVYRAKGRPKLSILAQVLHLVVLIPVCLISVKYGFWVLVIARSWVRLQGIIVNLFIMKFAIGISIIKMLKNVLPSALFATLMGLLGYLLQQMKDGLIWDFTSILLCMVFYFSLNILFRDTRLDLIGLVQQMKKKS